MLEIAEEPRSARFPRIQRAAGTDSAVDDMTHGFPGRWPARAKLLTFAGWAVLVALLSGCRDTGSVAQQAPSSTAITPEPLARQASTAARPSWQRPLLYRVVGNGTRFYVFGTIHLPDDRLEQFPPALEAALAESDAVFTEISMTPETQASIAPLALLPRGQALSQLLTEPLYSDVMASFAERGVPSASLEPLKPWALALQLALLDRLHTLAKKKPLDALIYERAAAAGKAVAGIESAGEQIDALDKLAVAEQVEYLRQTLAFRGRMKAARRDVLGELLEGYVAGDDALVHGLMREGYDESSPVAVKVFKRLITDRNATMTTRILARVRSKPKMRHLFAIGAGHVVGENGTMARLERHGFKVERVE